MPNNQSIPPNRLLKKAADMPEHDPVQNIREINAALDEALRKRGEGTGGWKSRRPRLSQATIDARREYNRINSLNPY